MEAREVQFGVGDRGGSQGGRREQGWKPGREERTQVEAREG